MNNDTLFLESLVDLDPRLKQLAEATAREVVAATAPPDAERFASRSALERRMRSELEEAATEEPNELDRRPDENRAQHRARLRALRRTLADAR